MYPIPYPQAPPDLGSDRESSFPHRADVTCEVFRVDILKNAPLTDFCADLTRVPSTLHISGERDLAWCLDMLIPLRNWLEINGAFTPSSGIRVRAIPASIRPADLADELAGGGTVLDSRQVTVMTQAAPRDGFTR